ncbi:PREDICTED: UDP-glucuronosyltransferase 2B1-like [Dufourea novaeangliae]|uniref:UDP-glucuronosyltransferase 2B1-like n=1 Tax=Dufourea novaeangliae TaxID=178035 RepID=UPI000767A125|nr:PREDICTED: UDP-glucuronosyltransferase 2B1-like [Dufourea novaeangliae]
MITSNQTFYPIAHPNIVLYIYQGGLQSTEEAIEYAVPVLGMPVFADQNTNVNLLVQYGVAKSLDLSHLTKETFKQAVTEIITNRKYKENVTKLRDLFRDLPYQPMEHATWWIEHVIRHKGAKHLRSGSRDLDLWKFHHLDILAKDYAIYETQ